jgi:hypothetical protein
VTEHFLHTRQQQVVVVNPAGDLTPMRRERRRLRRHAHDRLRRHNAQPP